MERTVRVWLGLKNGQSVELPEMPYELRRRFLRCEEYEKTHRDQWGEWEHSYSASYQDGKLWIPEVDRWVSSLRRELRERAVPLEPLWPDGRDFAVCLTHDVDLVSEQSTFLQKTRQIKKFLSDRGAAGCRPARERISGIARTLARSALTGTHAHPTTLRTIETTLRIEKELGVFSSFLFTAWPLSKCSVYDCVYSPGDPCNFRGKNVRVSDVMRTLAEEGFDVGLHGSYYSATSAEMLAEQKMVIQRAVGVDVVTTRQHWLKWNAGVTPRSQSAAGLLADSSMGFNRNIGFRSGTGLPYLFFDAVSEEMIPILEVPLVIHEGALFGTNALEYDVDMARDVVGRMIDETAEHNSCLTMVVHPHSLVDGACEEFYSWFLGYCIEKRAWVTSLRGVYEWWKRRERMLGEPADVVSTR